MLIIYVLKNKFNIELIINISIKKHLIHLLFLILLYIELKSLTASSINCLHIKQSLSE